MPNFKRALRGLYHGKKLMKVNKVAKNKRKTIRHQKPNVHYHTLKSEILDRRLRLRVSTKALRTIDKKGGLDNYILTTKDDLIPGKGQELKKRILNAAIEQNIDVDAIRKSLKRIQVRNTDESLVNRRQRHKRKETGKSLNPWTIDTLNTYDITSSNIEHTNS